MNARPSAVRMRTEPAAASVADLARFEDRWAVAVLHDMFQQATGEPVSANGPNQQTTAEPAAR